MNSVESAFDEFDDLHCFGNGVSSGTHNDLLSTFLEMSISIVEIREGGLVTRTHPNLIWILRSVGFFMLFLLSVFLHREYLSCLLFCGGDI